jgi:hypothetical protein
MEARTQVKIETAKNLLDMGLSFEQIVEATGLSKKRSREVKIKFKSLSSIIPQTQGLFFS